MADMSMPQGEPAATPGDVVIGGVKDAINPVLGHPEPPKFGQDRHGPGGRNQIFRTAMTGAAAKGAEKIASAVFKVP